MADLGQGAENQLEWLEDVGKDMHLVTESDGTRERKGAIIDRCTGCVWAKGKWELKASVQPIQPLDSGCVFHGKGHLCQLQRR